MTERSEKDGVIPDSGLSHCYLPKREIYEARRQAIRLRNQARDLVMPIAKGRFDVIKEYVNQTCKVSGGGVCVGLAWNAEDMVVDARWDTYEGIYPVEFPQELIWSDAKLVTLRAEIEAKSEREKQRRDEREIAERDRLIAKHPVGR